MRNLIALLAALLVVVGCGARPTTLPVRATVDETSATSPGSTDTVGTAPTTVANPTAASTTASTFDPSVPLIAIGGRGGGAFCSGHLDLGVGLAIYADGTVIRIDGCAVFTASTTGHLDPAPLVSELDDYFASDASRVVMDDFADLGYDIADAGTSELSYQDAAGTRHFVSAFALGLEPDGILSDAEVAARQQLEDLIARVYDAVEPAAVQPWSPSELIVTRLDDAYVDRSNPVAWPVAATPELLTLPTGGCLTLTRTDVAAILPLVAVPYAPRWWSVGDQGRALEMTPVVPGVHTCADPVPPADGPTTSASPERPSSPVVSEEGGTVDPSAPFVTVSFVDGFWCQGATGPSYAAYHDGTALAVGGCAQPNTSTQGRVDVAALQSALDGLVADGVETLVMNDFGDYVISDVGSTVIEYRDVTGHVHRFRAYALGMEPATRLSEAERSARTQMSNVVDMLWKQSDEQPWVPGMVTVTKVSGKAWYADRPTQQWPLATSPELQAFWGVADGSCLTLTGPEVATLVGAMPGTDTSGAGQWSLDGVPAMLFVNVVVPGHLSSCP